jgi:hypothetical protein
MANIDLSGYTGDSFNMIGYETYNESKPFTGVFDGNDHTISNFTYTTPATVQTGIGVFGLVDEPNAVIKDVELIDCNVNVEVGHFVASLVGLLHSGTVSGCYGNGGSVSGEYHVGGLVGNSDDGTITDCYSTVSVTGKDWISGLVGYNSGTITDCNVTASVTGVDFVGGLVGRNGGTITNCCAQGGSVSGNDDVGGLVGYNYAGTIINCHATASVSGHYDIGGLIGDNWGGGTITNSYSTGNAEGNNVVGGLAGVNTGTISNCYATGPVTGETYAIGGLVGSNGNTINNCYATGPVTGETYAIGGLIGSNSGSINNCCSTGSVEGDYDVGGLVGINYSTINNCYSTASVVGNYDVGGLVGIGGGGISYCYWDIETSGQTTSPGGTGLPTAEMQMQSTFTDAGWDFVGETANGTEDIWKMNCETMSYPKLSSWQPVLGDFICPDGVDFIDFAVLAAQWRLPPAEPSADIAPNSGDNIVDRLDLAAMADNWLSGF